MTLEGVIGLIALFVGTVLAAYRQQTISIKSSLNKNMDQTVKTHLAGPVADMNSMSIMMQNTLKAQSGLIDDYHKALAQARDDAIEARSQAIEAGKKLMVAMTTVQETQDIANTLRADNERSAIDLARMTDNQKILRANVSELESQLEAVRQVQEHRTTQIQELERSMKELAQELATTKTALALAQKELERTQRELEEANRRIAQLQRDHTAEREKLETDLRTERDKVTALQKQVDTQNGEITRLTGEVTRLKAQLEEAQKTSAQAENLEVVEVKDKHDGKAAEIS